jgi:hypothetical protein
MKNFKSKISIENFLRACCEASCACDTSLRRCVFSCGITGGLTIHRNAFLFLYYPAVVFPAASISPSLPEIAIVVRAPFGPVPVTVHAFLSTGISGGFDLDPSMISHDPKYSKCIFVTTSQEP